ncbi:Kazal-type serine protease inhibitor domain protein [Necator americanus]|uniref:Kazal-type serine protease inhibitor domain protein n=1 Tax=Necator americanus TaxID=51031 RepID=W2SL72_NECAM|nr:Kazal-type serine protease inhibitor domain protein [Necator americanus]ETN70419.1 Kazal-type serine protease inhibitor domain protein [Necator americanus]
MIQKDGVMSAQCICPTTCPSYGDSGEGLCASFACNAPLECVVKDDKPSCVCPQCTDELREVCASDGRTYSNACKMRKAACEAGVTLFVKYNGICGTRMRQEKLSILLILRSREWQGRVSLPYGMLPKTFFCNNFQINSDQIRNDLFIPRINLFLSVEPTE